MAQKLQEDGIKLWRNSLLSNDTGVETWQEGSATSMSRTQALDSPCLVEQISARAAGPRT